MSSIPFIDSHSWLLCTRSFVLLTIWSGKAAVKKHLTMALLQPNREFFWRLSFIPPPTLVLACLPSSAFCLCSMDSSTHRLLDDVSLTAHHCTLDNDISIKHYFCFILSPAQWRNDAAVASPLSLLDMPQKVKLLFRLLLTSLFFPKREKGSIEREI